MGARDDAVYIRDLQRELKQGNNSRQRDRLLSCDDKTLSSGTQKYLSEILDHITELGTRNNELMLLSQLNATLERLKSEPSGARLAGFVALICLNVKLLDLRFRSASRDERLEAEVYCNELFASTSIRDAIRLVYRPASSPSPQMEAWEGINFGNLAYHRAGTTSFILKGERRIVPGEGSDAASIAIKCVLFPWNKLPAIVRETEAYFRHYGNQGIPNVVVKPSISSGRWIIMPFQEGKTLGEHLSQFEESRPSIAQRVNKARHLARALTRSLHILAGERPVTGEDIRRQHLDLSPNNIIIEPGSGLMKFIDLGVNSLYSRQVGIAEHDDSIYVAPEIKNRNSSKTADAYSLGIILMQVLSGEQPRDGRSPDQVWEITPILGRVLDDLVEEDPKRRYLLQPAYQEFSFEQLGKLLDFHFELAMKEGLSSRSRFMRVLTRVAPTSREFRVQFLQWREVNENPDLSFRQDRYLLFFSFIATLAWWFIVARTALVKLDDAVAFKIGPPPSGMLLAASIIALSQGLVAAKYYQTVLARLTARNIPGILAGFTELYVRLMCLVALPTTILSTFWKAWLWPWTCAAGALAVALCNFLLLTLSSRIHDAAAKDRRLSTVPPRGRLFARGFEQWWWTMLLYALIIIAVATGLQSGILKDIWAYVFVLTAITVGIHYLSKCVSAGGAVRGGLARALAAGERLVILENRTGEPLPPGVWPPRLRVRDRDSDRDRPG